MSYMSRWAFRISSLRGLKLQGWASPSHRQHIHTWARNLLREAFHHHHRLWLQHQSVLSSRWLFIGPGWEQQVGCLCLIAPPIPATIQDLECLRGAGLAWAQPNTLATQTCQRCGVRIGPLELRVDEVPLRERCHLQGSPTQGQEFDRQNRMTATGRFRIGQGRWLLM
eukprot:scaffold5674_cov162-Pinguiococcus_pyrenoidosus.AAC.1